MPERKSIASLLVDNTKDQMPEGLLTDLLETLLQRLKGGKIRIFEGPGHLVEAARSSGPGPLVGVARFDNSLWEPCMALAFRNAQTRGVAVVLRYRNMYCFALTLDDQLCTLGFDKSPAEGLRRAAEKARAVAAYFAGLSWSDQAFSDFGKDRYFAVLSNRLHDGLYALASATIASRRSPRTTPVFLENGNLVSPAELPYFRDHAYQQIRWQEAPAWRDAYNTSWIEAFSLPVVKVRKGMQRLVRALAPPAATARPTPDAPFTVFVSYEAEKRAWLEQEEGFDLLCTALIARYGRIRLLMNGMTAPAEGGGPDFFPQIRQAEEAVLTRLQQKHAALSVEHLFGMTVAQKTRIIAQADFFLGPVVSAILLPMFLGVPGLAYGNRAMLSGFTDLLEDYPKVRAIPASMPQDCSEDLAMVHYDWAKGAQDGMSYSIDPQAVVAAALEQLGAFHR